MSEREKALHEAAQYCEREALRMRTPGVDALGKPNPGINEHMESSAAAYENAARGIRALCPEPPPELLDRGWGLLLRAFRRAILLGLTNEVEELEAVLVASGYGWPDRVMDRNPGETFYAFELRAVAYRRRRGDIATAAFLQCTLCGRGIDSMGGLSQRMICVPCGTAVMRGQARGCIVHEEKSDPAAGSAYQLAPNGGLEVKAR